MKSRKKVSRKKTSHKTRTRRSRSRSRGRTKRGGMFAAARRTVYHDILPLLSQVRINIHLGRVPKQDEGSITKENERFYETILDIPVDDGIKESIKNLREELSNPVKSADKWSSVLKAYDIIIKTLEEEKRKQSKKQPSAIKVVGKPFTPTPTPRIQVASAIGVTPSPQLLNKENILNRFVKPPFSSPDRERNPQYLTNQETSANPRPKNELTPEGTGASDAPHPETPIRNPFTNEGPFSSPFRSPPPPDFTTNNNENYNPQLLLSPGPGPATKLVFSDES